MTTTGIYFEDCAVELARFVREKDRLLLKRDQARVDKNQAVADVTALSAACADPQRDAVKAASDLSKASARLHTAATAERAHSEEIEHLTARMANVRAELDGVGGAAAAATAAGDSLVRLPSLTGAAHAAVLRAESSILVPSPGTLHR